MVFKKGAPPSKNGKKQSRFNVFFTADMVEEKRGRPPGKNGKQQNTTFTVLTARMPRGNPGNAFATPLNQHSTPSVSLC